MKGIKTILGIALATTGFGGAVAVGASAVVNNQNNEAQIATAGTTTRIYLDMSGFSDWYGDSAHFGIHTWNSGNGDKYFAATKVGDAYYYADVDLSTYANGGGYRFTRFDASGTISGSTEWNRGAWCSYSDGVKTYYKPSGYTNGTWSTDDQQTWSVTGGKNGNWSDPINISLTMRFNDEGLQFYNSSVELSAGDEFKIKNGSNSYYGYNCIETGDGSVIASGDVSGSGGSNITVVNTGSYEIYMKPFAGKFWMQENSENTATSWASSFISATGSICSSGGTSANHESALSVIWTQQKTSFEALTLGARNIIKTGTANATIKDAHDRYVHIMTRYTSLDEFSDWKVSPSRSINVIENNNYLPIIIVSSTILVAAFVGVYFFLRKKKEQ